MKKEKRNYQKEFWDLSLISGSTTLQAQALLSKVSKKTVETGFVFFCQANKENLIHWYLQNNNKFEKFQISDKNITKAFINSVVTNVNNQLNKFKELEDLAFKYNVNLAYDICYEKAFCFNMKLELVNYIKQKKSRFE